MLEQTPYATAVKEEARNVFWQCRRFNIDSPQADDFATIRDRAEDRWFEEEEWNRLCELLSGQSDGQILENWRDLKEEVIAWRLYSFVRTHLPELSYELLKAANFMGPPSDIDQAKEEDLAGVPFRFDPELVQGILILLQFPPEDAKALKKAIRKRLKTVERRRPARNFVYAWAVISAVAYIGFVLLAFSKAQSLLETEVVAGFVLLYATIRFRFALAFPGLDERFSYIHRALGNMEPPAERRLDGWSENWGRIHGIRNDVQIVAANATVVIALFNLLKVWLSF